MKPAITLATPAPRLLRHLVRVALYTGAASGLALLALLAWSTGNASRLAEQYGTLLLLNSVFALALFVWMSALIVRLVRQWRSRQFGVHLTTRLALAFALIGVAPGLLIYLISVQFMSRSIESWFNVRVDSALEAGLNLGRAALDARLADLLTQARRFAAELARTPESQLATVLTRLRQRSNVREALVFTGAGRTLVFSTIALGQLPELPASSVLNSLRVSRLYAAAEADTPTHSHASETTSLRLRVIVPLVDLQVSDAVLGANVLSDTRWLQLVQPVAAQVSENAARVQDGFRDYQELALSRLGLRKLYGITLTLALLFTVFGSVAIALSLSRRLVRPLLALAAGTRAVSAGDFRPLPEPSNRRGQVGDQMDEIGALTRSFNAMTRQLGEARRLLENQRQQLERANLYLESVLANLSSGVLAFDERYCITMVNRGAQTILRTDLRTVIGQPLETVPNLLTFATRIRRAFAEHAAVGSERTHWQQQFELTVADSTAAAPLTTTLTLLARGTHLLDTHQAATPHVDMPKTSDQNDTSHATAHTHGRGFLVVFDDISDVISANRTVAWGEVARRLAHEIKNPLTPIQLSAERLALKLSAHLAPPQAAMLARSVNTIVNQVASLKNMVDSFREYARTPPVVMTRIDFNALVAEVLTLYGWEPDGGAGVNTNATSAKTKKTTSPAVNPDQASPRLEVSLAPNLPAILGDAAQLRQVIHNLLANATDAVAAQGADGVIRVTTQWVEATMLRFAVADSGSGFSPAVLARATEPYVTTKAHGSGLGLAIVDKIVSAHGARLDIDNRRAGGARVSILFSVPDFAQATAPGEHHHDNRRNNNPHNPL